MKKIVLTGGGTAGHVTPNIALLPSLEKAGYEIYYIGSYDGIEKRLMADYNVKYYGIATGKFRRYFDLKNFSDPFRVLKGYRDEDIYELSELFKVFGDHTRLRILFRLFVKPEAVGDLAQSLDMTQSAVSHQLSMLKKAKLVAGSRNGKSVIYSLADDHVRTIIAKGMEHVTE